MAGTNDGIDMISLDKHEDKDTKERIVDVAIDLFAQKGFDNVTMQEIADVVGIKKASLYYHFSNKGEILEKVLEYPFTLAVSAKENMGLQSVGLEERVVSMGLEGCMALGNRLSMSWVEDPRMEKIMRIIYVELYHNELVKKFHSLLMDHKFSMCVSIFTILMKHKLIKPYDPKVLAREYLAFYMDASAEYFLYSYGSTSGSFLQEYRERIDQHIAFIADAIKP